MYRIILILTILSISKSACSRDGMWLPQLLKELNESEMKSMGMEISADDIYSVNHSSLKDAVLQFGGGCTGELISGQGLLITNHHCGFSQIQSLSSIEKNYLKYGYWSEKFEDEIPCPGLTVTFIREITDVTSAVLDGISDSLSEDIRSALVMQKSDSIEKTVGEKFKGIVRPFYNGNKYYLFKTEVYSDIRFVGAPPQSIGKFGGETDNWIWPRHTGDFSLFRIYADKNNQPALYSKDNIPYTPKQFLTISISGVKENDFVFVFGFPGRTYEYLFSSALEVIEKQTNPNRILIRDTRLNILREEMKNDTIRLKYAAKFATLSNSYKKWKGELLGFSRFDPVSKKRSEENKFKERLKDFPAIRKDTSLINTYAALNESAKPLNFANDYYVEGFAGIEIIGGSLKFKTLVALCDSENIDNKKIQDEVNKLIKDFRGFYKNYSISVDKKICAAILKLTSDSLKKDYLPDMILKAGGQEGIIKLTDNIYNKSLVADSARLMKFLSLFDKGQSKKIKEDPAYKLAREITTIQLGLQDKLAAKNKELNRLQRKYMNDLLITDKSGKLFPDANSTLRISYGQVKGTIPFDGMNYNYYTTIDGIADKAGTGNPDYEIPPRLGMLIKKKDYGQYASNGTVPVAYMTTAHTTGGNSGSPSLNAKGELIGLNYDRTWEGVLSDYYYDENYCRNINLDIRYALFIIEKYGNAKRLIGEMRVVQ